MLLHAGGKREACYYMQVGRGRHAITCRWKGGGMLLHAGVKVGSMLLHAGDEGEACYQSITGVQVERGRHVINQLQVYWKRGYCRHFINQLQVYR